MPSVSSDVRCVGRNRKQTPLKSKTQQNPVFVESKLYISPTKPPSSIPKLAYLISGSSVDVESLKRTLKALKQNPLRFISNSDQLQFFNSQGYLVIESFSSSEEVEALRKRMDQLLDGFDCSSSTSIFSTKNQQRTSDDYFYDSADKISFFFEEKAFDDDGNLKQPRQLSINKEKLYLWISKQYAEGLGVTTEDILAYIQAELESSVEESPIAPRTLQPTQVTNPFINPGSTSVPAGVQSLLSDHPSKNYIFSNALSSPVRRSLQNYHISSSQDHSFDSSMDADTTCQ
ncbi:hypothetical protein LXL04_008048 [Taraxacum kok-saghyz]